jgi:hypothetical protein
MTFMQARTANEVLKAQERRLRLQRMKGEMVDRAKAVAQVFKLAREERDAWVNWPARVTAIMAAELGLEQHQLHTVLERQVREHLPVDGLTLHEQGRVRTRLAPSSSPANVRVVRRGVEVIEQQARERADAGLPLDGLSDLSAEGERDGFYQAQLIREPAVRHVTSWTGVELEAVRRRRRPRTSQR